MILMILLFFFWCLLQVRIFQLLDEPIIDAICERLRTKTYIKGSKILCHGGLVDKMVFIIRGKMESIGEDLIVVPLSEGDVCGEELLTWCLEHSSVNKGTVNISNSFSSKVIYSIHLFIQPTYIRRAGYGLSAFKPRTASSYWLGTNGQDLLAVGDQQLRSSGHWIIVEPAVQTAKYIFYIFVDLYNLY